MNNRVYMLIITLTIFISKLNAGTIYVSASGDDESGDGSSDTPYLTIQKGIDEATTMDTVMVLDGIYTGGVIIDNKQISLIGESMTDTKINVPITEPNISIMDTPDTVRIENFKIKRGNSADGGGLYINSSVVTAKNLDLSNNTSSADGGAINLHGSSLKLENAQIYLNSSETHGGAIHCNNSDLQFIGGDVYNNSSWAGGAIFVDSLSTCSVADVNFNNNGANRGGAIATFRGGRLTVHESDFYLNSANGWEENVDPNFPTYAGGGAIYQEFADSLEILNTTFSTNSATYGPGGALALYHGTEVKLVDVAVRNNSSLGGGGGICLLRPENVTFNHGVIMDNISTDNSGGGIFFGTESLQDTIDMPGTFSHLLVVNNWALYGGGGLFTWNATLNLFNSTFVMNEATDNNGETSWQGGGLAIHSQTTANIVNTIFYDNTPNSIHDGTPNSGFDINYSLTEEFWNGDSNSYSIDPLFVDVDDYDFRLQTGSPCIDAGTSDLNGDDVQDYFDFNGNAPDLGAIEWVVGAPELLSSFVDEQDSSVILAWNPIVNENFQYYRLQRSTDSLFSIIDAENFVTDVTYTDGDVEWNQEYFYRVSAYLGYWTEESNTTSVILGSLGLNEDGLLVNDYKVYQNFPNPFNPITTISYKLPKDSHVRITIYDMMGRLVKNLLTEGQSAGHGSVKWNATNDLGESVSAGMYFYIVDIGELKQVRKMLYIK